MHITDYLHKQAAQRSNEPAIICEGKEFSWQELDQQVSLFANFLQDSFTDQDTQKTIGILMHNSWQFLVTYLGILEAGYIAMPFDPNHKQLEIETIAKQIPPDLMIVSSELSFETPSTIKMSVFNNINLENHLENRKRFRQDAKKQIASLLFTSGTTGKPKATAYSHNNHIWNILAVKDMWQWTDKDSLLLSLPLSHWHAMVMGVAGSLVVGNKLYLQSRFDAEETLRMLASGQISLFMHVPIAYFKLVEYANPNNHKIKNVRLFVSGSSFLPPAIWKQFKDKFGYEILERYGASETGLITSNNLDKRLPGCVGKPIPGVDFRLESDGEIAMKSPGLFLGYYNNEAANKAHTTKDGWWLTNDIGSVDKDGNVTLKGRLQEKIIKLGYTIYPRDVEWALLHNSQIKDVVVIGIQDQTKLSDELAYFIVGEITNEQLAEYCKKNLPNYWRPDKVIFLDELPKTRSGKPQIAKLKEML